MNIDLGLVARDLHLPIEIVQRTVELLEEGNTVPFLTRFRKDLIHGLDEEQVRHVQAAVARQRQLAERKQTILRSIESQGSLTPELAAEIQHTTSPKRLEDLYLPYKIKKQSLAAVARGRGLAPLAQEVLAADPAAADLPARAAQFLNPEQDLPSVTEVLAGVGHLIAEGYSENVELRGRLRRIFHRSGRLICSKIETPPAASEAEPVAEAAAAEEPAESPAAESSSVEAAPAEAEHAPAAPDSAASEPPAPEPAEASTAPAEASEPPADAGEPATVDAAADTAEAAGASGAEVLPIGRLFEKPAAPALAPDLKSKKKKKKKKVSDTAFKDYFQFQEPLSKLPPHRVLAINRGERARAIRVKIEADVDAMVREAEQLLVPPDHPHAAFLRDCVRDALQRLIVPSLERECRRELTERAEEHAVDVFIRNLRKLLLTPPVRGRRVLAVDPGFKSGCKLVALDEFGNLLGHGVLYVIGKEDRRQHARQRLADLARRHDVSVIAIGNGTGCRETEQLVADTLAEELKDREVEYVVVNEAGASIYSTSPLGREELPGCDALQRGAVSIGRRLLDPLSELVKISPANIGVGLYQHDIKARHLRDSLDSVVESAVNQVGVDVNAASPALLRYVSGMNALTARRVYEYRREHGPFRNREELRNVPGLGDATFVQAAGFLKVLGGDNPLDATWIHPESYDIARRVLERLGSDLAELALLAPQPRTPVKPAEPAPFAAQLQTEEAPAAEEPVAEAPAAEPAPSAEDGSPREPAPPADSPAAAATEPTSEPTAAEPVAAAESAAPAEPAPAESPVAEAPAGAAPAAETPAAETPAIETPAAEAPVPALSSEELQARRHALQERAAAVDVEALAQELQIGPHALWNILQSLARPGLDPRDSLPPPIFRRGIMKLEDLQPGMELSGTVLNVVDFGAFVDIGLTDSGLVHISRLADRFIRDPHEVVSVGDVLKVWVVEVDKTRRRVSLTAIPPGSERPPRPPREQRPARPPKPAARPASAPAGGAGPPPAGGPPPRQQRPPRGGRFDKRGGQSQGPPRVVDRPPTKPKPVKPISKAMEEGKEPLRSFSDLLQFFDKKRKPKGEEPPPPPAPPPAES